MQVDARWPINNSPVGDVVVKAVVETNLRKCLKLFAGLSIDPLPIKNSFPPESSVGALLLSSNVIQWWPPILVFRADMCPSEWLS
jgi:hypothetical protein